MNIFSGIRHNIQAHDRVALTYESSHGEIFNAEEQSRLHSKLSEAARLIKTGASAPRALDMGCGSGNLTAHLLDLGFHVTAADVSKKFLDMVERRFSHTGRLETVRLNGKDLAAFTTRSFDLTATYSVLHHVPDYLEITREMARVTNLGGVVYIDHEHSPDYWENKPAYAAFLNASGRNKQAAPGLARFFHITTYINKVKQLLNPRYRVEGDIHVWPDDHIDWTEIEKALSAAGCSTRMHSDYLLYRRDCPPEVYRQYSDSCTDMRVLTAAKL